MVRAGGSASRTIDDNDAPDPGEGGGSMLVGDALRLGDNRRVVPRELNGP